LRPTCGRRGSSIGYRAWHRGAAAAHCTVLACSLDLTHEYRFTDVEL
jgi:hypothetical protein